jgi:hypothetical protein
MNNRPAGGQSSETKSHPIGKNNNKRNFHGIYCLGHVTLVPCHHSMECPQAADRGKAFYIWRAAVNILITQLWTATRSGPPAWRLSGGLTTHHRKIQHVMKCCMRPRTWMDTLERFTQWEMDMRFGTWNVRSIHSQV